jgi:hypothetical protein
MATPGTQHLTLGNNRAEAFIDTRDHQASLILSRNVVQGMSLGEVNQLIDALQAAKKRMQAFQMARIHAGHAELLLAA